MFVVLFINLCNGQNASSTNKDDKFVLNPWENVNGHRFAVGYFNNFEAEYSYLITSYPNSEQGFGGMINYTQYIGLGAEYLRIGNENVLGAKLSYENTFFLFAVQLATDFLVSDKDTQVRLMPKVGLSLFGYLTIYYGWNISLRKESSLQTHEQIISLQLNIF